MKLLQFPTCRPMNGLFVHWSRGWGVLSFSERLVNITLRSPRGQWVKVQSVSHSMGLAVVNNSPYPSSDSSLVPNYWVHSYTNASLIVYNASLRSFMINSVYPKNFHNWWDIWRMSFIYSIQICEISHQTFGLSHRNTCPMCPMICMNTELMV